MKLNRLGVWAGTAGFAATEAAAFARRVEAWGHGALWIPEAVGREAFSACAWLLAGTNSLYVDNWRRSGFSDTDFAGGGSDRLIDALIVWGDEKAIRARIEEHWQAGADHVCVQAVGHGTLPDEHLLGLLAPRRPE